MDDKSTALDVVKQMVKDSVTDYKKRISARYQGGSYYKFLTMIGYARDTNLY